ncbi:MAG: peptidase M14 [Flavobacteriales bacterium]|jgi:hypothetical protein|nr:peptidase M14 [Flavobacteriales bacterium]
MNISTWYKQHYESRIKGRYVTLEQLQPIFESYSSNVEISTVGTSEKGISIPMLKIGKGKKVVLAWSQMHGNESTTTKAVLDLLLFLDQDEYFTSEVKHFLKSYTFYVLPILNPDGAIRYTRLNANDVDLNRDAKSRNQQESKVLYDVFNNVEPDLCLNLHDQRTIYGLPTGLPATVSFLAPSADPSRSLTAARKKAMRHIERMNAALQQIIPGQVGRYDDSFNENCVGDHFQQAGVPTILFEAGHYPNDYDREKTREFIFYAFLALFKMDNLIGTSGAHMEYSNIPENQANWKDIIIREVRPPGHQAVMSIAIQYAEELQDDAINFVPRIDLIGNLDAFKGHVEIQGHGATILLNSQENIAVGTEVLSISDKNNPSITFFSA